MVYYVISVSHRLRYVGKNKFPNTDEIYKKSFFIGLPTKPINNKILSKIKISFESALK